MTSMLYLGYAGHGNLGDDAIRDALQPAFASTPFYNVPVRRNDLLRAVSRGESRRYRGLPLLLGGGTVLGRTLWRRHFLQTAAVFRPASWSMIGAGVEDPSFLGDRSYTSPKELRGWRDLLLRFPTVTVRGPRSAEILADVGIESEVVGDPALLLGMSGLTPLASRTIDIDLLVNVTAGEDQWGGIGLDWTATLADAIADIAGDGLRIEFVSLERADEPWIQRLQDRLGTPAPVHHPKSTDEYLTLLTRVGVLLGTRLHANIIAAAAQVPSISLEYRPKCRDFMRSIDAEDFCFRVDRLDRYELSTAVRDLTNDRDRYTRNLTHAVERLRIRLEAHLSTAEPSPAP